VRPASPAERRRLNETFAGLCAIPSPSGQEAACAQHVTGELRALGLDVLDDEAGNLLARIPARSSGAAPTILLCAHLDTVGLDAAVEPVLIDDGWENRNDAILGADNKAAVAVLLELARRCAAESSPVGLELLFTVREEEGLAGATAFDVARLESAFGFVFDHATPIGEVVVAAPTYFRFEATFRGVSAHAGIRPETGRSAVLAAARAVASMPLGRLDAQSTANVGRIEGGGPGTNVVPDRCCVLGECRSLDPARAESLVGEIVDALQDAANAPDAPVDVDVVVERLFEGYRHRPPTPALRAAEAALRAHGHEPRRIASGGGSDANAFEVAGLHCVNLANGTERNHQPDERVSVAALEGMLDVALDLLEESAHV
ncbi:MAG: M20/M25/M40 family metallo-hydrolase, partial [Solirubrobacterales bacterium]|nr:M20/M25/M40 family metallo-hydrolase [Solirubrobacterales bacterium]